MGIENSEAKPLFKIESKEGVSKRLTIECAASIDNHTLFALQDKLKEVLGDFTPSPLSDIHLTLCHLGKPDDLFYELSSHTPSISRDTFDQELQKLLNVTQNTLQETIEVSPKRLNVFESGAVVLELDTQPFKESKSAIYKEIITFLEAIGLQHPKEYIPKLESEESNLYFALFERWTPHFTLGWTSCKDFSLKQDDFQLEQIPPLLIHPSRVRNAHRL